MPSKSNDLMPLVMLVGLIVGGGVMMQGKGGSKPAPVIPGEQQYVPSVEFREWAQPVVEVSKRDPAVAKRLAQFYRAGADILRRDASIIGSTKQLQTAHTDAQRLFAEHTSMAGKLDAGDAIEGVLLHALDMKRDRIEDVVIDAAKRRKLAEAFDAVAWALEGGK